MTAVTVISSPFVLLELTMDSANFLACNNITQVSQQIRLPMLNSLLQRCLQLYVLFEQFNSYSTYTLNF